MGTLARSKGLGTCYVTNGYITEEALREPPRCFRAFRVDIKSFSDDFYRKVCGAHLQPVLDAAVLARELGMHIETVTLVIPGMNDSMEEQEALIRWVIEHLGPDTPMHFSAFHPDYRMTDRGATPVALLEKICSRAKELGLRSVPGKCRPQPLREHLLPGLRCDAHRAAGIFEPYYRPFTTWSVPVRRNHRDRAPCPLNPAHLITGSSWTGCLARSPGTSVLWATRPSVQTGSGEVIQTRIPCSLLSHRTSTGSC